MQVDTQCKKLSHGPELLSYPDALSVI